jgi:hypothetical protein
MDHELEEWIEDTSNYKWPVGRSGGKMPIYPDCDWRPSRTDAELRRRIFNNNTTIKTEV